MRTSTSSSTMRRLIVGLFLGLLTTIGLLSLEAHFRPIADHGIYFQQWSSERMMQTVSIEDLREDPIRSLWYLHIQPPAFDAIRAFLAQISGLDDPWALLWRVDRSLLILWAFLYGMTVFVVFWWLSDITGIEFAEMSALLFSAHPALIFYATLLDTTLLSAFLILWFCYLLWRIKEGRSVPVWALASSFLALFFTRSVFQWQWLLILPPCLLLLRLPVRKVLLFLAIAATVVGLYTAKQASLFGLSSTSSFIGLNLSNSIGLADSWQYYGQGAAPEEEEPSALPRVLTRVRKIDGALNYNNAHYLEINRRLQHDYFRHLLTTPPRQLAGAVLDNLMIYLQPSSHYTSHIIVDRLPWRWAYDFAVSFPVLPLLIVSASLFWLRRAHKSSYCRAIGLWLPVACIVVVCVLFDRGENMRFKFFVEPALFVFLASQVYAAGREVIRYVLRGAFKPQVTAH